MIEVELDEAALVTDQWPSDLLVAISEQDQSGKLFAQKGRIDLILLCESRVLRHIHFAKA
jgi:hypothetical protein